MYHLVHKMNNGKEKILETLYKNKLKKLYFSEILRETNLTPNTTLKHLNNLNNLIKTKKTKAHTFYKLNPCNPQIYSILSYFDYKRLNSLEPTRKRAIIEFLNNLKTIPIITLVFGSTAKKTYTKKSDIDILIVYNKKENINKIKHKIEAITGISIQSFIIDFNYFKEQILINEDKVITHAIKTGFVVQGHYMFYKEILKCNIGKFG